MRGIGSFSSNDLRPGLCRNRLRDEGSAYPKSGCAVCKDGGLRGCPYERIAGATKPCAPPVVSDVTAENKRLRHALQRITQMHMGAGGNFRPEEALLACQQVAAAALAASEGEVGRS